MNAYCPECETDLDQVSGICPACRWDPYLVTPQPTKRPKPGESLTERYRGTPYETHWESVVTAPHATISRGRAFVIVALLALGAFYGVVFGILGAA